MKIYKHEKGILLEHANEWFLLENQDWDLFINDDDILNKCIEKLKELTPLPNKADYLHSGLQAPLQSQEIWASGVTYYNSKLGREEESKTSGGSDFYAKVYTADRPELFFKSNAHRTVGPGGRVRIRRDSTWNVPEPELTLMITSSGKIIGYTIGNDMSSRSIEGENPLYLPQAKTYDGSAALGPGILLTNDPLPSDTTIHLAISRKAETVFSGQISIDQIKRQFTDLVAYLFRECSFPQGCLLMTGTGIVPGSDFTLQQDDEINITIDGIGTLVNTVG